MQEVTSKMGERGIDNMEWIGRDEWRRKIKFWAQKDVNTKKYHVLYRKNQQKLQHKI